MKFELTPIVVFLSVLPSALAWGNMGHEAVAYVATNFGISYDSVPKVEELGLMKCLVSSATKTYFQNILGDTTSDYLANVATYVCLRKKSIMGWDGMGCELIEN